MILKNTGCLSDQAWGFDCKPFFLAGFQTTRDSLSQYFFEISQISTFKRNEDALYVTFFFGNKVFRNVQFAQQGEIMIAVLLL